MINYLVLLLAPLLGGLLVYLVPKGKNRQFKLILVFAGSYLFAITVSHILPELYRAHEDVKALGLWVLIGFFLQQVLEYFSVGIEHGHIHLHKHENHNHPFKGVTLLLALCVHAFLEGAMLAQPDSGSVYNTSLVLAGITLHRMPAAFALMVVLVSELGNPKRALPYLVVFASAAPLGLLASETLIHAELSSATMLYYLYALVCGNFLHISTTIVFESSPEHHFNARRLLVALIGAAVAIGVEYLL